MKLHLGNVDFPLYLKLENVRANHDKLLKDTGAGGRYKTERGEPIPEPLLNQLQKTRREKIWVSRHYRDWFLPRQIEIHKLSVHKKQEISEEMSKVHRKLQGIYRPAYLKDLVITFLESMENPGEKEKLALSLEKFQQLRQTENKLLERLHESANSYHEQMIINQVSDLLANPGRNPAELNFSTRQQELTALLFGHLFDLLTQRALFANVLAEEGDEKIYGKIQGQLSQYDEKPPRPALVETIHDLAIKNYQVEESNLNSVKCELLSPPQENPGSSDIKNFFDCVRQIFHSVVVKKVFYPHLVKRLNQQLTTIATQLPDPYWGITEPGPTNNNLISQAINRLLLYAQNWPQDLLDREFVNRLPAILFREVGLLERPQLVGRCHPVVGDRRVGSEEIDEMLSDSLKILKAVSGFPPEALEVIDVQTERSGPETEWVLREANRIDVCSAYDVLTTEWAWRPALSPGRTYNRLWNFEHRFGTDLLNHFCSQTGVFPSATEVYLGTGQRCLVERQTDDPELPIVVTLLKRQRRKLTTGEKIDLRNSRHSIGKLPKRRIAPWKLRRVHL